MTRKNRLKAKVTPFVLHMAAIADVSRMSIIYILSHGPQDVRELMEITGIPQALMSHHLTILRKEGWVSRIKFGKRAEYSIESKAFLVLEKLFKGTFVEREVFTK